MDHDGKARGRPTRLEPDTLTALGLGPDAPLMNDPKIFVDVRFLSSLIAEIDAELGRPLASRALFEIGARHGVRDARRVLAEAFAGSGPSAPGSGCAAPSLVMRLVPHPAAGPGLGFDGDWPEAHEAQARLRRLGRAASPSCALSAGYTSGWLSEIHDLDIVAVEIACAAEGAEACHFRALERALWPDSPDCPADELPELDRQALAAEAPPPYASTPGDGSGAAVLDPDDEAVHIWGPVMVLPFTRPEDALATVGLLGREHNTTGVRVVVVDLRHRPLDPGFGAELLAQTLDAVESWGAEAILTGVCTLSEPLVAELAGHHLLTHKDLPEAVASAFQIAEALRHPV